MQAKRAGRPKARPEINSNALGLDPCQCFFCANARTCDARHTLEMTRCETTVEWSSAAIKPKSNLGETMKTASLFVWFARESLRAAATVNDPRERETWMKLAKMWAAAARLSSEEGLRDIAAKRLQRRAEGRGSVGLS